MTFHLLIQQHMMPVPNDINIIQDFGNVDIAGDGEIISGSHMIIDGSVESIKRWLSPFDGFWRGKGQPFEQQFEVAHVKG